MFNISALAKGVGLSRSTLLYYEKLGLLKRSQRQPNGYRVYSEADRQRLLLLQRLQAGGLSLKECRECLDCGAAASGASNPGRLPGPVAVRHGAVRTRHLLSPPRGEAARPSRTHGGHACAGDLRRELRAYHQGRGQFGYEMFVLEHR